MSVLDSLVARLVKLQAQIDSKPVMRWATVTESSPLRIQLDGDAEPLNIRPDSCVGGVVAGDRVRVEWQNNRITILGVAGGMKPVGSNRVLNGAFDVWQRGTSGTPTSAATAYVADRFESYRASYAAGLTISRQSAGVPGIQYAARVQRAAGNATTYAINIGQAFESVDSIPLQGKTVTFSFYARKGANFSGVGSNLNANVVWGTGTDQNLRGGFTGFATVVAGVATLTTGWQRFTFTGVVPVNATQIGVRVDYTPAGTAGANDWFELTGVQLETGGVSVFTRQNNSYQQELAGCQRYFCLYLPSTLTIANRYFSVNLSSGSQALADGRFIVPMRTTPSVLSPAGSYLNSFRYFPSNASSDANFNIRLSSIDNQGMLAAYESGDNGGLLPSIYAHGTNNNPVWVSAEL